jgi:hypothetical protein
MQESRKRWWGLVFICVSLLVISLDNTVLNVALPSSRAAARVPANSSGSLTLISWCSRRCCSPWDRLRIASAASGFYSSG